MTDPDAETRDFVSSLFRRNDDREPANDDDADEILAFAKRLFADPDVEHDDEQEQQDAQQRRLRSLEGTGSGGPPPDPNAELRSFVSELFGLDPT